MSLQTAVDEYLARDDGFVFGNSIRLGFRPEESDTFEKALSTYELIVRKARASWTEQCFNNLRKYYTVNHHATFRVCTWNVNGEMPQGSLADWLISPATKDDMIVVGLQEMDLSNEAYLRDRAGIIDFWQEKIGVELGPAFKLTAVKQLVGISIFVYARSPPSRVTETVTSTAATGIMSLLGNKGGAAVSLKFDDTRIAFVCCHLAAQVNQIHRRNSDYHDIVRKLGNDGVDLSTCDLIFFLGDLNYRLDLPNEIVREMLEQGNYDKILNHDQLREQMKEGAAFTGMHEADITFPATFKYDKGQDTYDTSEKSRTPSWTDRILFSSDKIEVLQYNSVSGIVDSDHKPVYLHCRVPIVAIVPQLYRLTREKVQRKLDTLENLMLPKLEQSTDACNLGTVQFRSMAEASFTLTNSGPIDVFYAVEMATSVPNLASHVRVWPETGIISRGSKREIHFKVLVTHQLPGLGDGPFELFAVTRIVGGQDLFQSVHGDYISTFLGKYIPQLLREDEKAGHVTASSLPSPLYKLFNYLMNSSLDIPGLFLVPGDAATKATMLRALSEGSDLDSSLPTTTSRDKWLQAASALVIDFFAVLPSPFITASELEECESTSEMGAPEKAIEILDSTRANILMTLCGLLKLYLTTRQPNPDDVQKIASHCCHAMFDESVLRNSKTYRRASRWLLDIVGYDERGI